MADLAFTATFAVVHISCYFYVAFMILETMGKQDQELVRFYRLDFSQDQLVVDDDEGPPHLIFVHTDTSSHEDQQWEQKPDDNTPDPAIKKQIFPPEYSEDQRETATDQEKYNHGKNNRHNDGEFRVDITESHIGNQPEDDGHAHKQCTDEKQQKYKGPLFRLPLLFPVLYTFEYRI